MDECSSPGSFPGADIVSECSDDNTEKGAQEHLMDLDVLWDED